MSHLKIEPIINIQPFIVMSRAKIVVVGPKGCGKTTWVRSLMNMPTMEYKRTLGVEVHMVNINDREFEFWDTAGDPNVGGLRDGYYVNADAIVLMGDANEYYQEEINYVKSKGICCAPVVSADNVFEVIS